MRWMQATAIVAFVLAAATASATTYYVDGTCGNDAWSGLDPVCAWPDGPKEHIQAALDIAGDGDIVIVYDGPPPVTYAGTGNVNLDFHGAAITLCSASGNPFNCIIDGGWADRAFLFDDNEPREARVEHFTIQNCYAANGGAVRCDPGSPTFVGCRFENNSATGYGGAVWSGGSGPRFETNGGYRTVFYQNQADLAGGAVHAGIANADPYPEFDDCRFLENSSDGKGGAMNLLGYGSVSVIGGYDSYFVNNTAATTGGAVAIDWHCTATFTDIRFQGNDATDDGGAVFIDRSSEVTFSTCTFPENTVGDDGGAIYNRDGSHIIFSNCDFTSNVAASGGGAIKNEAASCEITGGEFEDNEATANRGGALRNIDGSSAVITDAVFTDNSAGEGGGAVHNQQSTLETSGCSFSFNVAGTSGGAIRSTGDTSSAQVTSCDFTGNSAGNDGGAIAGADESDVTVMTDCNFLQNSAGDEGGALASQNATATVSSNTDFNGNSASNRGGAIANLGGSLTVSDCTFPSNNAGSVAGAIVNDSATLAEIVRCDFSGNMAVDRGGALLNVTSLDVLVDDCTFSGNWLTGPASRGGAISNWESPTTITASVFTNNQAILGGGIHNQLQSHAVITDCVFETNSGAGGGIHNAESDAVITDCVFNANTGPMGGGGIFNADSESVISWCEFTGNTTPNTGGGIHHQQANPLISPLISWCDFTGNTADISGGGIHITGLGQSFIHNCEFLGNVATNTGGGVHCNGFDLVELANCLFADNSAGTGAGGDGGAVRVEDSVLDMNSCTLSRNHADTFGGGVSVLGVAGATLDIDDSILWENDDSSGMTYTAQIHLAGVWFRYVDYSCVYLWPYGGSTLDCQATPPVFTDPAADNYHLLTGSPCVDSADNTAVPPDTLNLDDDSGTTAHTPLDLDAKERFIEDPTAPDTGVPCVHYPEIVDMGCYERCSGDVDGDGDTDHADLGALLSAWCCVAGDPNWNPNADLDGDGHVGHGDLGVLLADWGCGT